jgi:hypothetical protein
LPARDAVAFVVYLAEPPVPTLTLATAPLALTPATKLLTLPLLLATRCGCSYDDRCGTVQ